MPTILVVEDQQTTREGLLILLARAGYRTVGAATLNEAKALLREFTPDLLIVDIRLSGDNGLQLIATAPRSIPAIVITAFEDPILAAEARHLGADFMMKPVPPSELLGRIEQKLASLSEAQSTQSRRWPRTRVSGDVTAMVGDVPARIVDVGYGGVRFETPSSAGIGQAESVRLAFPGSVPIGLHVVWNRRSGDNWQCGATVNDEYRPAWKQLVDKLSSSVD